MLSATRARRLVLASASSGRFRLLQAAGLPADVVVSGVDESTVISNTPHELCGRLAQMKAEAVADLAEVRASKDAVVIGCDSVLAFQGQILGKPAGPHEAFQLWQELRGKTGLLCTGHCLVDTVTGRRAEGVAETTVHFASVTDQEIAAYVKTGEPLRMAGSFTIDGLGGPFVERIEGDFGTVVGLSLPLLRCLLQSLGFEITDFWQQEDRNR
jgi:septum formation protein